MITGKYCAFISYRHHSPDMEIAKRLHTLIENYRIPSGLRKESKHPGKVFRDQEELPLSADLGRDIEDALDASEWLICICSPRYMESRWCMRELEYFIEKHGRSRVLAVLAEGEPEAVFPPVLCRETDENGQTTSIEPLAADVRGKNLHESLKKLKKEKLRLLAPMLDTGFDSLYQRQRRRAVMRGLSAACAALVLTGAFLAYALVQNSRIDAQRIAASRNECDLLIEKSVYFLSQEKKRDAQQLALQARQVSVSVEDYQEDSILEVLSAACYAGDFSTEAVLDASLNEIPSCSDSFSPDSTKILCPDGYTLCVCDAATGKLAWRVLFSQLMTSVRWNGDGTRIAVTSLYGHFLQVLDAGTGECLKQLNIDFISNASWWGDELWMYCEDGLIIWNTKEDPEAAQMKRYLAEYGSQTMFSRTFDSGRFWVMHKSPMDGTCFCVIDRENEIKYEYESELNREINSYTVSPDGKKLFLHQFNTVCAIDLESGAILWETEAEKGAYGDGIPETAGLMPVWSGNYIFDNEHRKDPVTYCCTVYRADTGEKLYTLENEACRGALPEHDLFIGSSGLYGIENGTLKAEAPGYMIASDRQGARYLMSQKVVTAVSGGTQYSVPEYSGTVWSDTNEIHRCVSPDNRYSVNNDPSFDRIVSFMDLQDESGTNYYIPGAPLGYWINFSPDSRYVALGGTYGNVGLYDLTEEGRRVWSSSAWMLSALDGFTFSRDGAYLMCARYGGSSFFVVSVNQGLLLYEIHPLKPVTQWGFDEASGDAVVVFDDGSALFADLFTSPEELYAYAESISLSYSE